ncbi:esterase [Schlegelella sp. ID0723]|uniref:Esterase n=2 Tax=Piscinibacter koreensis TaxID=2742824 RepID=A0A7Y6TWV2_9BURK|nr:esterase [Schlegelella koreensis]
MSSKRVAAWCGGVLVAAVVAACGGGEQVSSFEADRVIALGDESSVIEDVQNNGNGRKYTVNATVSETDLTLDCLSNPLWIQVIAANYGTVFPECNPAPNAVANPASRIRAKPGARIADLAAQIAAQQAESPLNANDMVTVLVGQNDVLALYAEYPTATEAQLLTRAEALGVELGRQINAITDMGPRVLVSTVIDVGETPFGRAEDAAHPTEERAGLLSRLTERLNEGMRATLINDGRRIGLVLTDGIISRIVDDPDIEDFDNAEDPACDLAKSKLNPPSVLDCTVATLVPGATVRTYLWADNLHLSPGGQALFGDLARDRAQNNPF